MAQIVLLAILYYFNFFFCHKALMGFSLNGIVYLSHSQQVLRKADMIRKNAVESILAERDILISVRNPFVVSRSS